MSFVEEKRKVEFPDYACAHAHIPRSILCTRKRRIKPVKRNECNGISRDFSYYLKGKFKANQEGEVVQAEKMGSKQFELLTMKIITVYLNL